MASWYPEWGITNPERLAYGAFALFLGILLPVVLGFAFGYSVRHLRPLPTHVAILAIGTFVFGVICVVTVSNLQMGDSQVVADFFKGYHSGFVLIPAGLSLITAMFYTSSAFIGHARRRQKAGESSRAYTSVREASDQPQTPRQQAMGRLSGENWTPRQQAMVGLIGTLTAALIGFFGVLVQVVFS
jgi:ABC-type branched-subunit amino acid transport system permease subunit